MNVTISLEEAVQLMHAASSLGKQSVLVGGVFDILHVGHVRFLEQAKKEGDILFVALEPDLKVEKSKGKGRPINNAQTRAYMLSSLSFVDHVFVLPLLQTDQEYRLLTKKLAPSVIAVTEGDPYMEKKKQYAQAYGGRLAVVTPKLPTHSTTQLIKLLSLE